MKGIILAAGKGSRTYPNNLVAYKPLQAVYDKPMIYYSIATLMDMGIRDIAIIVSDAAPFKSILDQYQGIINITYIIQEVQDGVASAIGLAKDFIGDDENYILMLGDNIFISNNIAKLSEVVKAPALVAYDVYDTNQAKNFGVAGKFYSDPDNLDRLELLEIEEKPKNPKSSLVITGMYYLDSRAIDYLGSIHKSERGEYEITDVNNSYISDDGKINAFYFLSGEESAWFDTGNSDSILQASNRIQSLAYAGSYYGYLEIVAYQNKWISQEELEYLCSRLPNSVYRHHISNYLLKLI